MLRTYMRVQGGVAIESFTLPQGFTIEKCWPDPASWVDTSTTLPPPQIGWQWDGKRWSAPVAPMPAIPDALAALSRYHDIIEAQGVMFQAAGQSTPSLFLTDPVNAGKISSAYAAATANPPLWVDGTPIRTADNRFVPMTSADVIALAKRALTYIGECAARAAELAAVITGSNPGVSLTSGWPSQD